MPLRSALQETALLCQNPSQPCGSSASPLNSVSSPPFLNLYVEMLIGLLLSWHGPTWVVFLYRPGFNNSESQSFTTSFLFLSIHRFILFLLLLTSPHPPPLPPFSSWGRILLYNTRSTSFCCPPSAEIKSMCYDYTRFQFILLYINVWNSHQQTINNPVRITNISVTSGTTFVCVGSSQNSSRLAILGKLTLTLGQFAIAESEGQGFSRVFNPHLDKGMDNPITRQFSK